MSRPKFVRDLTPKEKMELSKLIRTGRDARAVRRAQMVHLSAGGRTCAQISGLLGFTVPTVHRVIQRFGEKGLASLFDEPRSGRPPKVTNRYVELLKEAVATSPREMGYAFTSWTLARLREHLARRCHVLLHPDYLARLMAKHKIVYRRPKHVMGHLQDPHDYKEKKALLDFLKKARSNPTLSSTSSSSTSVRFISTRP